MSGKLMGQIYGLKLTPAKREILLAMAENADDDGNNCHPGVPRIAWMTEYSDRQVQRIQRLLEDDGLLLRLPTAANKPACWRIDISKGVKKSPFVSRDQRRKGDKVTSLEGDNMSLRQDVRVTSHGNDEPAEGDIATGKMSSIPLKDDPKEKDKSENAPAHESTPLTFAHANGLGRTSNGHNPTVLAVKAHPAFQAYVRGRNGVEPEVPPPNAPGMLETLKAIQGDIDAGRYSLQDVEDLTRHKVGIPHSKAFLLSYIKTDIADFVGGRSNPNGAHPPARAAPPVAPRQKRDPALNGFDARQMVAELERSGKNDKGWNPFAGEEGNDDEHTQSAPTS